ncbi:MAG: Hint domain-containing protein [Jhaorihella sp.]
MAWIAVCGAGGHGHWFRRSGGLSAPRADDDALLTRGSLVIETRLPTIRRPRPLVLYDRSGDRPFHLSLQAIPGGGLTLVLNQGGTILHRAIDYSEAGRTDLLRITYSWDAPARRGHVALERTDRERVLLVPVPAAPPLRMADARLLMRNGPDRHVASEVLFLALSGAIEPVGPMPSLLAQTPIATPRGYRPAGSLQRGDTVLTPEGGVVPVLQRVSRTVPALGSFRPVLLRAPYFGLQQDITVAPSQRLVLSGSEVEYLFNREAVLVEVRHLVGGTAVIPAETGPTVTYTQLLLPRHEAVIAAGTVAETLYIGRLRRQKERLAASVLAGLDRHLLPEHGKSVHPVLSAFDAIVLAEQRAA